MKRIPRKTVVKARALTNPQPTFVSLVKGGANQRPFRAVKMEAGIAAQLPPTSALLGQKETSMPPVPEGFDITALHFALAEFADETAVKAWLDAGGYTDVSIKAETNGFEVLNTAVEFEPGTTQKIEGAVAGLTVYVGKVAQAEVAQASTEDLVAEATLQNTSLVQPVATKNEGQATEVETALTEVAKTLTITGKIDSDYVVTKAFWDANAVPVEPTQAADPALDPAELAIAAVAKLEKVSKHHMGGVIEFGSLLQSLKWIIMDADYVGLDEVDVSVLKGSAQSMLQVMAKLMQGSLEEFQQAFKMAAPAASDVTSESEAPETVPAAEAVREAVREGAPVTDDTSNEPIAAPAVTDPALEADEALQAVVAKAVAAALSAMGLKAPEPTVAGKVEAAPVAQTRKGADVSTEPVAAPSAPEAARKAEKDAADRAFAVRRQRMALGLSPEPSAAFGR